VDGIAAEDSNNDDLIRFINSSESGYPTFTVPVDIFDITGQASINNWNQEQNSFGEPTTLSLILIMTDCRTYLSLMSTCIRYSKGNGPI
jgi:hypothetical protein